MFEKFNLEGETNTGLSSLSINNILLLPLSQHDSFEQIIFNY